MDSSDARTRETRDELPDLPAQEVGAAEAAEVKGALTVSGTGGADSLLGTTYGGTQRDGIYSNNPVARSTP